MCPYCPYSTASEMQIKSHVATHSSVPRLAHAPHNSSGAHTPQLACPLCQEPFAEKSTIQKHLTSVHNVNSEGLQKLLALVEDPKAKMAPNTADVSMSNVSLKLAKEVEVDMETLESEYAHLASEDGIYFLFFLKKKCSSV